jgi:hypothetical protein
MATRRKGTLGGARPGSGRPALFDERVGLTVQLERSDYDALRGVAHRRGVSVGTVVRELIRSYLARRRKR